MSGGLNLYGMLSGIGDQITRAGQQHTLGQLGGLLQAGDFKGASSLAFQAGDVTTGLGILRLAESRDKLALERADAEEFNRRLPSLLGGGSTFDALTGGSPRPRADSGASVGSSLPTFAQGSNIGRYAAAIQANESGGKYDIVGPTHPKMGRALGAYQVMEANLPSWTREAVGREVGADEFLRSPAIQDAVFQKKFGQAVEKYGNPQDAASVWFTGRPLAQGANARDVLGTTGQRYVDKFNAGLARAGGTAPTLPATRVAMPASMGNQADIPAEGAMPAQFYIPGTDPASAVPDRSAVPAGGRRMTLPVEAGGDPQAPQLSPERADGMVRQTEARLQGAGISDRMAGWAKLATLPHLPESQRQFAQTMLKAAIDEAKVPESAKEFMYAKRMGWTQARTPADYAKEKAGPTTLAPGSSLVQNGQIVLTAPDREKADKTTAEFEARKGIAAEIGLVPGTPQYQRFMAEGKVGSGDPSPADKKAIMQAEDAIPVFDSQLERLNRAKELNDQTYTGITAAERGYAATAIPGMKHLLSKEDMASGAATREFGQLMSLEAIKEMSAVLKGATTEKEMATFTGILSDPTTPPDIRARTIDRMIALTQRQKQIAEDRVRELRGGTYYGQGGGQGGRAPAAVPQDTAPRMPPSQSRPGPSRPMQGAPGQPSRSDLEAEARRRGLIQ